MIGFRGFTNISLSIRSICSLEVCINCGLAWPSKSRAGLLAHYSRAMVSYSFTPSNRFNLLHCLSKRAEKNKLDDKL